jgi:hypothetical protein
VFRATPDRLKGSDKLLTYDEIIKLGSIESALEKFIDKEIDSLLRESHEYHISYLEKELKIDIKNSVRNWKEFVEITERRNLFVHTGGVVSKQYINLCRKHGIDLDKIDEGAALSAGDDYFQKAYRCFFESSIVISQLVYRKLWADTEKLEIADSRRTDIGINLLINEKWEIALSVFDFALSLPVKLISDDAQHKIYIINKCIALKGLGQKKKMLDLLGAIDWSAVGQKYQLGISALKDEYDKAESIMSSIGKDIVSEENYRTWPVFNSFRETKQFARAFNKLFDKDFDLNNPLGDADLLPAVLVDIDSDTLEE